MKKQNTNKYSEIRDLLKSENLQVKEFEQFCKLPNTKFYELIKRNSEREIYFIEAQFTEYLNWKIDRLQKLLKTITSKSS